MATVALIALRTPLQHYISLNRYQHVSISVFLFGVGYFMQLAWSYKTWSKWARISHIVTGLFFTSVGLFFYTNNWSELSGEMTMHKVLQRYCIIFVYLLLALFVSLLWIKALWEDQKIEKRDKLAAKRLAAEQSKPTDDQTT